MFTRRFFLRKIPLTGKHLSLLENPLGGFPCRSCRSKSGAIACASQLQAKKRELKLSSHIILFRLNNQLKMVKVVTQSELSKDS